MTLNPTLKKILLPASAVLIAVVIFAGGYWARGYYDDSQQKAAAKAGETFVSDIVNGKTAEAYKLTTKSLQAKQTQAEFEKILGNLKADKPTTQAAIITKNNGMFYFSQSVQNMPPTASGNTTGTFLLTVTKVDGAWKVDSASVN